MHFVDVIRKRHKYIIIYVIYNFFEERRQVVFSLIMNKLKLREPGTQDYFNLSDKKKKKEQLIFVNFNSGCTMHNTKDQQSQENEISTNTRNTKNLKRRIISFRKCIIHLNA